MNLLAHSHLGKDLDGISNAANVLWDFIGKGYKGEPGYYYRQGKDRHLLIDRLADGSQYYQSMRQRISPGRRKAANLLTDIFSDYFLAKHWDQYSDVHILEHIENLYASLIRHSHIMGEKADLVCRRMKKNWFLDYLTIDGVGRAIRRVSRRASSRVGLLLKDADIELGKNEKEFETGFMEFYQEMIDRTIHQRQTLSTGSHGG